MTINSRHSSWKEFHLSKKKGTEGFLKEPMKFENLLGSNDPFAFVNDPSAFLRLIDLLEDECFLLLPAGGNQVNLVHSCFKATAATGDEGSLVFGILGSRRSSPFKRVNVGQAVMHQASPRVTRPEERKDNLVPSMKDFAKCICADDFRDWVAAPEGKNSKPAKILRELPSSCFVHRSIFKIFGDKGLMRAGDLDGNPKLPAFTKKILEDRDSNRAIGEMKTISKRWSGKISKKGTLSFLTNGCAADDKSEAPGGFSIFMFSPLGTHKSSDQKSRILQVRSMFGSTELDEDSIKYFAKKDFYLADNLPGLEEQICTCIKLLEKLTCKDGIASEGYRHGFEMPRRCKKEFLGLTRMDPLFPVKFAYLLDRAFQNFVLHLGDYHNSEEPILRARRALKGQQQVQDTEAAMSGFKTGGLSKLFLPRTLQTESLSKGDHPSKDGPPRMEDHPEPGERGRKDCRKRKERRKESSSLKIGGLRIQAQ
jgi:hypothetical protein